MSHDAAHSGDAHGHSDHGHSPFLAHHFDDPEQQFDSGKLGMWLFLVTEVLFFSGMFCAYALYRSLHPEVWTFASQYLNETLGAFNTGVLLFSSLSMAWGVRCAQLRQRTGLVVCLAITLACASMFLGVKAIEYTHKWDIGLLPAGTYESQYNLIAHHEGISPWLIRLSILPAIMTLGLALWYGWTIIRGEKRLTEVAGPLVVTGLCYFLGVFIGMAFENAEAASHANEHGGGHGTAAHSTDGHDAGHDSADHDSSDHDEDAAHSGSDADGEGHADDHDADGKQAGANSNTAAVLLVSTGGVEPTVPGAPLETDIDQAGGAGLFFSIYYCMTGVHAVHILGGMIVLAWLLARATKDQFNEEYFGPVDYVGLYWHLVDLIWIYLFPLLYLIK